MSMFRVGQKVVCVNNRAIPGYRYLPGHLPVRECVYTVREILTYDSRTAIRLEEIFRDGTHPINDMPFYATRFRPIVERKTDISIFKAMLTPVDHEIGASA